ncbi:MULTISPECIES: DUF3224 domain-containing protein [Telluria group]|uniref:DUF3224 domain-containing protein n=1 Tax=Pseudoduganella violacea TaxID=1715466 RepID=A0A7W5BC64_9BURK|nr:MULTISPECIES: DUF3224 domain-containing protein [Telluria group]AKU23947.1 hypothetical protein ACZ75_23275 [Massilia sp. NR 4-1]MBB3120479.1 hypothetical protein [Pseudoduganella violacea]NVD98908.1 DUF3224 domain-containing protein [Massilia sp. BJB1822]UMR31104.1 DUF3224 domain-containing protein [Massilia sp. MB5]UTY57937.1 DUF3224 domain-containing protein [Massilia sp. erpn]
MAIANGEFDVKMAPEALSQVSEGSGIGRMHLDKRYHGVLDASGRGEFLSYMGSVPGSAIYVAVERVEGTLHGRSGSFTLVHRGVMGGPHDGLQIFVAPDSGTGELKGISGKLDIKIENGKHFYSFEYSL